MKDLFTVPGCSALTLQSLSGKNYWFRTCDIDTDIWKDGAHIVSFPAGSLLSFEGRERECATYGFMGITSNEKDTWLLDGVNEKGLVGGLLFLYEGTGVDKVNAEYEGYMGMELVTKFLSACTCVEEVKCLAEKIQVINIPYEGKRVCATMHYFFTDITGNEVILEATDEENPGCFSVYDKKIGIGVMTNSPPFPKQLQNLSWYIEASPELQADWTIKEHKGLAVGGRIIEGDKNAVHLLRGETFPGTYCSYDRFVRLAVIKALNEDGRYFEDEKMLALGSGIMSCVYEPRSKGLYHYRTCDDRGPVGQKDSYTQYLVMYDVSEKRLYLKVFDMVTFVEYKLAECDKKSVKKLEIRHDAGAGILKGN